MGTGARRSRSEYDRVESALIEEYVTWNVMYIMMEHGFGGIGQHFGIPRSLRRLRWDDYCPLYYIICSSLQLHGARRCVEQ
jgi:hypothetical protein